MSPNSGYPINYKKKGPNRDPFPNKIGTFLGPLSIKIGTQFRIERSHFRDLFRKKNGPFKDPFPQNVPNRDLGP